MAVVADVTTAVPDAPTSGQDEPVVQEIGALSLSSCSRRPTTVVAVRTSR